MGAFLSSSNVGLILGCGSVFVGCLVIGLRSLLTTIYGSIAPAPPTQSQLKDEDFDAHPLFRHVPALRGKVAWRQIGNYPTPVHEVTASTPDKRVVSFSVKREDLASPFYGGNKVRTLQHQLAACEAYAERVKDGKFHLIGSHGSNQVVATKIHGQNTFHLQQSALVAHYPLPDLPDLDNTLNLLSTLSMGGKSYITSLSAVTSLISALVSGEKVFCPGGNNVTGVLGQVGAMLELAEQIERGETPDPAAIYLPYGSGCTTTGLVIGAALSRQLDLRAFRAPNFKIVAVVVHHTFAALHARLGALHWTSMPLSVAFGIDRVTAFLRDAGGPDIRALCHAMRREHLEIFTDPSYVGRYGSHSRLSLPAARAYDASAHVSGRGHRGFDDATGAAPPPQWLCGHFAAKPYALMAARLAAGEHAREGEGGEGGNVLFWQTKSRIQPLATEQGPADEAAVFEAEASAGLKKWAAKGKSLSETRQGSYPANYRHLMKEVSLARL